MFKETFWFRYGCDENINRVWESLAVPGPSFTCIHFSCQSLAISASTSCLSLFTFDHCSSYDFSCACLSDILPKSQKRRLVISPTLQVGHCLQEGGIYWEIAETVCNWETLISFEAKIKTCFSMSSLTRKFRTNLESREIGWHKSVSCDKWGTRRVACTRNLAVGMVEKNVFKINIHLLKFSLCFNQSNTV